MLRRWFSQYHPRVIGGLVGLVTLSLWSLGFWQPLERLGYNTLSLMRQFLPHATWDDRVVVIAIDGASLKEYGQFPWPRTRYVELLNALSVAPPTAIGFDILFAEPTPEDPAFAEALQFSGNAVLGLGADAQGNQIDLVPILAQASHQGHVYNRPDPDGISRIGFLYIRQFPSLAVALLQVRQTILDSTVSADPQAQPEPPIALPQPHPDRIEETVWINWLDSTDRMTTYSFVDVVQGKIDPQRWANKILLVGQTATAQDPLYTPLNQNPPTAGVYLHAAAIDNLLHQRFLQRVPDWALFLLLPSLGILTGEFLNQRTFKWRSLISGGLILGWWLVALLLFSQANLWLPVAAPLATILFVGASTQLRDQYEKQFLLGLFAKYVSPEAANLIWQRREELFQSGQLQTQELIATVVFTDIRSFTSISENLAPHDLLDWLNLYLDAMTDCIMDHGGVVDKYIGDAIMAVFGVPLPRTKPEDIQADAINAVTACLEMHDRLKELNQRFKKEGRPQIKIGVGIHTGLVVAGNVGGSRRLNYSVMGDTVNIASRLESMNKEISRGNPFSVLVTGETFAHIKDCFSARPVNSIKLRGREKPTLVCAILGRRVTPDA